MYVCIFKFFSTGPAAKQNPCTEIKKGIYYNGDSGSAIPNVASVEDCMSKCNADSTCVGWSYASSSLKCWTQTSIKDPVNSAQYTGGSCVSKSSKQVVCRCFILLGSSSLFYV